MIFVYALFLGFVGLHSFVKGFTFQASSKTAKALHQKTWKQLEHLPNDSGKCLWLAILTGEKNCLSKTQKTLFKESGLQHLFTPSGTHLLGLNWIFHLSYLKTIKRPVFLMLAIVLAALQVFPALLRVCLLRGVKSSTTLITIFTLVFWAEGAFWSWPHHYLSWLCSWLFLGLTLFAPRSVLFFHYLFAQCLLAWIFHQKISLYLIGWSLFGWMLVLLFPGYLLLTLLPVNFLQDMLHKTTNFILQTMEFLFHHPWHQSLFIHLGHLILIALMLSKLKHKRIMIILGWIFLSTPLNYLPRGNTLSVPRWEYYPVNGKIIHSHFKNGNIYQRWSGGEKCRAELKNWGWSYDCRPSRTSKKHNNKRI